MSVKLVIVVRRAMTQEGAGCLSLSSLRFADVRESGERK